MKLLDVSAERSIRVRDNVCNGSLLGRESRAWRAASFAEERAASGGGEGSSIESCGISDSDSTSLLVVFVAVDVDCDRVLAMLF